MTDIEHALAHVRERIAEAALRAGREPSQITLVAVSKTVPVSTILEAIDAGQCDFGENRVDEALPKIESVHRLTEVKLHPAQHKEYVTAPVLDAQHQSDSTPVSLRWHLIGHLQSRKAKDVIGQFDLIHSIDSVRLAEVLDRRMAGLVAGIGRRQQDVLLECNVSGEVTKSGFDLAGWERDAHKFDQFVAAVTRIQSLPTLRVLGLMTIAPIVEQPEQARPFFASLRMLREALVERLGGSPLPHLSMGMTDDFEAAIAEGATIVRIGRAIFGPRQP
ncbi:MAG: YggS family pyridoxal phosphate-dependent enzyme [Anaerolineae bacterium]|nr:YggS family pyridoxal phosphate-dependent enzyme [Thermoflexales bacterium]MDW8407697.1 YggS family pyridoxal phosphate-dependent enzyme [Anaerolineae bacterium]